MNVIIILWVNELEYITPDESRMIENDKYWKGIVKKVHYIVAELQKEGFDENEIMEWINNKVKEDMTMVIRK